MKRIVWTDPAKSDVRSLSKPVAMSVFSVLHRFAQSGIGNVKALRGGDELRLCVGDKRTFPPELVGRKPDKILTPMELQEHLRNNL